MARSQRTQETIPIDQKPRCHFFTGGSKTTLGCAPTGGRFSYCFLYKLQKSGRFEPAFLPFFRFNSKLAAQIALGLWGVEGKVPAYTGNALTPPWVHRAPSCGPLKLVQRGVKWAKIDPKKGVPGRGPFFRCTVKLAVSIAPGLLEMKDEVHPYTGNVSDRSEIDLQFFYRWFKMRPSGAPHR